MNNKPPHDWATSRAIDIIAHVHRADFANALAVVADMLRIAHAEGFNVGVESARDVFNKVLEEVTRARSTEGDLKQHGDLKGSGD